MLEAADAVPMGSRMRAHLPRGARRDAPEPRPTTRRPGYLAADIARAGIDAVTGNLFVGNPVFPLLATAETPRMGDPNPCPGLLVQ